MLTEGPTREVNCEPLLFGWEGDRQPYTSPGGRTDNPTPNLEGEWQPFSYLGGRVGGKPLSLTARERARIALSPTQREMSNHTAGQEGGTINNG